MRYQTCTCARRDLGKKICESPNQAASLWKILGKVILPALSGVNYAVLDHKWISCILWHIGISAITTLLAAACIDKD